MLESLFNEVADVKACNFIKKTLQHRCFPVNIVKLLKLDSHIPKKFLSFASFESPLRMMNNAFYFILKAFFILKIFKFLS